MIDENRLILLTGATGYVGGRLLPRLQERGFRIRCLSRHPHALTERIGSHASTEVVEGDVLKPDTLPLAMEGVDTAYYLVHSMAAGDEYHERDAQGAANFADAARAAGVRRIVYLGGLGDPHDDLSPHLRSRQQVGQVLRTGGVQVVEFRASIILGSGSLSYELIRALVERLPMMVCPRWVETLAQPIHIDDVLNYLLAGLEFSAGNGRTFEIGGPDRASYGDIMRAYARQRGLRRVMIRVPVLTPRLSSLWLSLVAPQQAGVGRELIEGVRNPTIVRDPAALTQFPHIRPIGLREALQRAADREGQGASSEGEPKGRSEGHVAVVLDSLKQGATHWIGKAREQEQRVLSAVSRSGRRQHWLPPIDVRETADRILIAVEVPGVEADRIDVAVEDRQVTIRGRRDALPSNAADIVLWSERPAGRFEQIVSLSVAVNPDEVTAEMNNGIMHIGLTKRPMGVTHRIPVKGKI